jgi:hypothetical protein
MRHIQEIYSDGKYTAPGIIRIDFTGADDKTLEQKSNAVAAAGARAFGARLTVPAAGRLNEGLGQELAARAKRADPAVAVMRVLVTSDEWSIERNDNTGSVIGRHAAAVFIWKDTSGKCMINYTGRVFQEYVGHEFLPPGSLSKSVAPQQIDCNNALKN